MLAGVRRREQRADRRGGDRVDLGRLRVGRRRAAVARLVVDAAAQPVHAVPAERLDRRARRALELDGAGAVVEAAGEVLEHDRLVPLVVALGDLPAQRRVLGADAGAARGRGVDVDLHHQARERVLEADVQRVADRRRRAERQLVGALGPRLVVGEPDVLDLAAALQHVGGRLGHRDREVLLDLEDDRLVARGARRADLGRAAGDQQRLLGRLDEPEADVGGGGARAVELDAEQLEQRDVELVRHAVEPVDRHLRHPREQLDERDARVGDVVLGPLGARAVDAQARLRDEVLEAAVVELDVGEPRHSPSSSSGIT